MQARYVSTLVATTALAATLGLFVMAASAAETEHDKHVFVNNINGCAEAQAGYVGSANGGVWRTTDDASSASPSDVAAPPAESDALSYNFSGIEGAAGHEAPACEDRSSGAAASAGNPQGDGVVVLANGEPQTTTDGLMVIRYLFGAGEAPPAEAATANAEPQADPLTDGILLVSAADAPLTDGLLPIRAMPPAAENEQPGSVQSGQQEQAGLLLPAVQKVRESAATAGSQGTGTLTLSNGGQAVMPEQPVCAHCGADAQVAAQQQAAAEPQPRERPRRNFSISIGGVTVGTGGVNVAVGDVNGDGRGSRSSGSRTNDAPPAPTRAPSRR